MFGDLLTALTNQQSSINARQIIPGSASGDLLTSKVALSFWGGVDPQNGLIIDSHHPLHGQSIAGKILAIPGGRGSCSGSGVILELLLNDCAPAALIFGREEMILTIGVIIAQEMFGKSIPVLQVPMTAFDELIQHDRVQVSDGTISWTTSPTAPSAEALFQEPPLQPDFDSIHLTPLDHDMLNGTHGQAAQVAMRVILRTAQTHGITSLIDVKQAHIDCCIYTGPATLAFAQRIQKWHAQVRIPTSLNAISIDQRLWRSQGIDPALGEPSEKLAQAYLDIGAQPTFTCAPYLLDTAPQAGENIIWAESNAVVFANSVLGARTIKCPDYLDVCAALTGRALNTGCHLDENRKATIEIHLDSSSVSGADESLFPLLGYLAGDITGGCIPIITGLEKMSASIEDLKAFGAAFATTSSAAMFHMAGITIEARIPADIAMQLEDTRKATITRSDLARQWHRFNTFKSHSDSNTTPIDLISLGNPHFSHNEISKLLTLLNGRTKHPATTLILTCNRATYSLAAQDNSLNILEKWGVRVVTDTCWCMIREPLIPVHCQAIITNSAKYAHYGRGLTGRWVRFGSLAQCVDAACLGVVSDGIPEWLTD